jgi:Uma2 family endonuclease
MAEESSIGGVMTADELLHVYLPGKRTELVRGRLIVSEPPGYRHGLVAAGLGRLIANHGYEHGLGVVVAAETGFKLFANPDTVRAPDAAFISRERAPQPPPVGYPSLAPDLAIEVMSPNDRAGEVLSKAGDWLSAGSRLVWVIDPGRRRAVVYRADGSVALLGEHDSLDGEDVLPGFSCSLAEVW